MAAQSNTVKWVCDKGWLSSSAISCLFVCYIYFCRSCGRWLRLLFLWSKPDLIRKHFNVDLVPAPNQSEEKLSPKIWPKICFRFTVDVLITYIYKKKYMYKIKCSNQDKYWKLKKTIKVKILFCLNFAFPCVTFYPFHPHVSGCQCLVGGALEVEGSAKIVFDRETKQQRSVIDL